MITNFSECYLGKVQNKMYAGLNDFAKNNPVRSRAAAIPVAVIDVLLQTAKTPLNVIECVVGVPLNLIGAIFSTKFSVKEAMVDLEGAATLIPKTIVVIGMSPLKLIYQVFLSVVNPAKAESVSYFAKVNMPSFRYMYPQA